MDVDTRDRILMPQQSHSISVSGEGLCDQRASAFHQYSEPCPLVMWSKRSWKQCIVDMLLTVQHHLPCMSRYSTMPLTVTIFKFFNVINLFQCDASDILKQILTFAEWDSFCFKTFEASLYYNTKSRCTDINNLKLHLQARCSSDIQRTSQLPNLLKSGIVQSNISSKLQTQT
jgi:hypothetical protein